MTNAHAETCAACGRPIEFNQRSYYRKAAEGDFGQAFHLKCGEPSARLIAAAPDLAAVVKDMLSGLQYLRDTKNIPYGFGIDRLEQTGKAAIAKAEGGR